MTEVRVEQGWKFLCVVSLGSEKVPCLYLKCWHILA